VGLFEKLGQFESNLGCHAAFELELSYPNFRREVGLGFEEISVCCQWFRVYSQAGQRVAGPTRADTLFTEPGSPWENGYNESFNEKLRGELLNGEIFYTLKESKIFIEQWRRHYNTIRPHSSLSHRPPAPETIKPLPLQTTALEPERVALH
jgi:hypothetical protein